MLTEFRCTDKNGKERTFKYSIKKDQFQNKWSFHIYAIPELPSGDFFEITVEELSENEVRIVMMNNHGVKEYSGAGIPDYMIPEISKVLEKPLISSSNHAIENDVYRTPDATKVWERLKSQGKAIYDSESDVYRVT